MSIAQLAHQIQSLPSNTRPGAFSAHASTATAVAASQFRGDATLKQSHPNSLCVTFVPSQSFGELCQAAYLQNTMGDNDCSYNKTYMVNANNSNIPHDGVIKECQNVSDPTEVCVPKGTVAVACNPDMINVGLNVGGGNFQLEPSYIAAPKSVVDLITQKYDSCYAPHPSEHTQKYAYTKTSSQVALSQGIPPQQIL